MRIDTYLKQERWFSKWFVPIFYIILIGGAIIGAIDNGLSPWDIRF